MRFCPNALPWLGLAAAAAVAGLPEWIASIDATGGLEDVFFRQVQMPSGPVPVLRPPAETRAELTNRIAAQPSRAEWYALRAREAERQLDFEAAEADWKRHAELSQDRGAAALALADYYRRRLKPREELAQLLAAARAPAPPEDRLSMPERRRAWQAFSRAAALVDDHLLPPESMAACYRAWIELYPRQASVYRAYAEASLRRLRLEEAGEAVALFEKAFPEDKAFVLSTRARMEAAQGRSGAALELFDRALGPSSAGAVVQEYFRLLRAHGRLREYLERTRRTLEANPLDWPATVRIFFYYQQQGDLASSQRVLVEYRQRRDAQAPAWKPVERLELAALLEAARHWDEAARACHAVYSDASADAASREAGLAGLIRILLHAPEEAISFGRGDLTVYRDIAALDPYPGFLNGLLSLVLNGTEPAARYDEREANAAAYFHRAKAAELLAEFDRRFPSSPRRAELHALLIEACAAYNDAETVIQHGAAFLKEFPSAAQRVAVSLRLAEAHAQAKRPDREFQIYESLLKELAAQAGGVPLGESAAVHLEEREGRTTHPDPVRSPEYARILDRYIARLVAGKATRQALAVYRRELDRNPNDPGLYERLAAFLDQNKLGAEIEQIYRRAMAQFPTRSWRDKLARWYLRHRRTVEFEKLTQEVIRVFSGSDLEQYFRQAAAAGPLDPQLFLRVNQYAWQRFPWNLTFVRNLLEAYQRRETSNPAAAEQLLRRYWFYDDQLRSRYFELLSRSGRLEKELEAARALAASDNPAALRFVAEAQAWACHFEDAAPLFRTLAAHYPGDAEVMDRAVAIHRSLAAQQPAYVETAAELAQNRIRAEPWNPERLATVGDIYADSEQLDKSRPFWDRMPETAPGVADRYLDAATVYWDYYRYDDALRLIQEGRRRLSRPALHAYQAGAIYEGRRDYPRAVAEYLKDIAPGPEDDSDAPALLPRTSSARRLIRLSRLPATRDLVESATTKLAAAADASPDAVSLRAAVLDAQGRKAELASWLGALARTAANNDLLARVDALAVAGGFDDVREAVLRRRLEITRDPVTQLRLRIELARWREGRGDAASARRIIDEVLTNHPRILGAVRAAANLHWRTGAHARAIDILERAAADSYPELRRRFLREAAGKAADSADYSRARRLLESLLRDAPLDPGLLATMADTWEKEGNVGALRSFYAAKIDELRQAALPAADKETRLAALRRNYIPILARLKDHAGVVGEYIEILSRFPGDESAATEAAQYALRHQQKDRLRAWCTRAVSESPKDPRWLVLLARLDTAFEDYAAAVSSYEKASALRPERTDLLLARAGLQERLLDFDQAAAAYARVFHLTYRNPQWMEKVAEMRARQARPAEAVDALEAAWVAGQTPRPKNLFRVARRLEAWGMFTEARSYAEKALEAAGKPLLMDRETEEGLRCYARIAARSGAFETAWKRIIVAAGDIENVASVLREMGAALNRHASPAQRAAFAAFLDKQRAGHPMELLEPVFLPIARAGGLAELEARWMYQALMLRPGDETLARLVDSLVQLQSSRMRHEELGLQLESYWREHPNDDRKSLALQQAAEAFRAAGNTEAEIRLRANLRDARYYELLARYRPAQLASQVRGPGFESVEAAVRYAPAQVALRAITVRGTNFPPVWTSSYLALAGLYAGIHTPEIDQAFSGILGPMVIQKRLYARPDPKRTILDDAWYYYAARYGEFLAAARRPGAEDFLPAVLEGAPASPGAYLDLGEYFAEARDYARALAEYDYALQLDPTRATAAARSAAILFDRGDGTAALARWRQTLDLLTGQQNRSRPPASFWTDARAVLADIARRGQPDALRPALEAFLRGHLRQFGAFRFSQLVQPLIVHAGRPEAETAWIASLCGAAVDRTAALEALWNSPWLPAGAREPLARAILDAAAAQVEAAPLGERDWRMANWNDWRFRWLEFLLDRKDAAPARAALEAIPTDVRRLMAHRAEATEIRLAVLESRLPALLERWRRAPETMPETEVLLGAASSLRLAGEQPAARLLLEHLYAWNLDRFRFDASNFLGLAEIRLEQGAVDAAIALLRRMPLVAPDPFECLLPAARLLERFGRRAEAAEFAARRIQAAPWDAEAQDFAQRLATPSAPPATPDLSALLHGIAADPANRTLRLQLFDALHAAGRHASAVAAFEPLLAASGLEWAVRRADESVAEEAEPESRPARGYWANQFLAFASLPPSRRAGYALALAESYERLERLGAAALLTEIAQFIQPSPANQARLFHLERSVRLRAMNGRRQPVFSSSIRQPRPVRPRLAALPGGDQ